MATTKSPVEAPAMRFVVRLPECGYLANEPKPRIAKTEDPAEATLFSTVAEAMLYAQALGLKLFDVFTADGQEWMARVTQQ